MWLASIQRVFGSSHSGKVGFYGTVNLSTVRLSKLSRFLSAKVLTGCAQVGLHQSVLLAKSIFQLAKVLFRQRFGRLCSFCRLPKLEFVVKSVQDGGEVFL